MEMKQVLKEEVWHYINEDRENFEDRLLNEAVNVSVKIKDILSMGNIDLLKNARKLVCFIINQNNTDLVSFAKEEGIAWAEHSLTLSLKLEWVQAIRRTIWQIISKLNDEKNLKIQDTVFLCWNKK